MPFDALRQNLRRSHAFEPLALEGRVPDDLRGTLFRVGPGVFDRFGIAVAHPFEADGAITAVRFGERVEGAAQVIESAGYREEQAAGRRLYGTGAGRLRNIVAALRQRGKNTANTSAWLHDGQLYALMEGARPTRCCPFPLPLPEGRVPAAPSRRSCSRPLSALPLPGALPLPEGRVPGP